jgi:hypothetical protein
MQRLTNALRCFPDHFDKIWFVVARRLPDEKKKRRFACSLCSLVCNKRRNQSEKEKMSDREVIKKASECTQVKEVARKGGKCFWVFFSDPSTDPDDCTAPSG